MVGICKQQKHRIFIKLLWSWFLQLAIRLQLIYPTSFTIHSIFASVNQGSLHDRIIQTFIPNKSESSLILPLCGCYSFPLNLLLCMQVLKGITENPLNFRHCPLIPIVQQKFNVSLIIGINHSNQKSNPHFSFYLFIQWNKKLKLTRWQSHPPIQWNQ